MSTISRDIRRIFDESEKEVFLVDAASHEILGANNIAHDNLGYHPDEIATLSPWELFTNLTKDEYHKLTTPLFEDSKNSAVIHAEHQRKDGSTYPVQTQFQYIAQHKSPFIIAISQDLTERRENIEALRLREKALDQLDIGLSITDARASNHPLVYVNKYLCELSGYSQDELIGKGVRILQKNDQVQPEHKKIEQAQAQGKPLQVVFKSTRKDGTQYLDELSLSPIYDADGELTHYIGVNRDISDRVNMENRLRQTEKIEAIGQLSGGVAHDFNNILSVISGNLELLAMDITDSEQLDSLNDAIKAANMGARLTRRLLSFAKQNKLEATVISPNTHIEEAMELLQSTIGSSISLTSELASNLWSIHVDPSEIENTIVNLVINARDSIENSGNISVKTRNISLDADDLEQFETAFNPGDYVQLSVSDTGCGMSEAVQKRIFEPFFTTKEPGKGTGLGLASIYGFVSQSGGWLNVYSEENKGTVVNIYLPRYSSEATVSAATNNVGSTLVKGTGRILVVEDNEMVRKVAIKRLRSLGYDTESARNGPEAVKLFDEGAQFDLVFSDVVMDGGMSGYDVAQWVVENHPESKVLLTSGFNEEMALEAHADTLQHQLLEKPYTLTELRHAIESTLLNS